MEKKEVELNYICQLTADTAKQIREESIEFFVIKESADPALVTLYYDLLWTHEFGRMVMDCLNMYLYVLDYDLRKLPMLRESAGRKGEILEKALYGPRRHGLALGVNPAKMTFWSRFAYEIPDLEVDEVSFFSKKPFKK